MMVSPRFSSTIPRQPISRAELCWLVVAILCGAVLRLGNLHRVAIEHFDETIYASNLMFTAEQGGEFPLRQFYAPPLLPAAIEWTTIFGQMLFGSVPTWWPMVPVLLAGLATIPSIWWIARQWFSPQVGLLAALLIACHEYHGAYSRTALTDVPLSFFLLWAVHGFWRALHTGRLTDAALAGLWTSLAWWTKYNGWLPLAIVASGGVFWQCLTVPAARDWRRLASVWLTGAATSFVLWLPVWWDCRKVGGYSKVAENHRGYVQGFSHWGDNLIQGYENFDEFVAWLTVIGLLIALACRFAPRRWRVPAEESADFSSSRLLSECLAGAWFWGLIFATPLYSPFSRLWTPWLLASTILLAVAVSSPRWSTLRSVRGLYQFSLRVAGWCCGLLIIGATISGRPALRVPSCLEQRDSFRDAAQHLRQFVANPDAPFVVSDSDPALWFNLRQLGAPAFVASSFEFSTGRLDGPGYLVLGPLGQKLPSVQAQFQRYQDRFELVDEYSIHPSRVALLDLVSARTLAQNPQQRTQTVQLYRVKKR